MFTIEATPYPTGTIQSITISQAGFASIFYEVALLQGFEIEVEVLADGSRQLVFGGSDEDMTGLLQAAYALENVRFWAEESGPQVLAGAA